MDWHGILLLWCAVCAAGALLGYARAFAGVTPAQRAVRATGRIVEVRIPAHGSPGTHGIPVVVAFPDPATGQEHTLPYVSERGVRLDTVWVGREVVLRHPPGAPEQFEVMYTLEDDLTGRALPHFAIFLLYAGLVADIAVTRAWPWALLGAGVPLTWCMVSVLRHDLRLTRVESARLAGSVGAAGRVVAVVAHVYEDSESSSTSHVPYMVFTTRGGTAVTARVRSGIPNPRHSYGLELPVRYLPDDPAVFTLDPDADRRSALGDIVFVVALLLAGVALTAAGAILL